MSVFSIDSLVRFGLLAACASAAALPQAQVEKSSVIAHHLIADSGTWLAEMTVGGRTGMHLEVDTTIGTLYVNQGDYEAGPHPKNNGTFHEANGRAQGEWDGPVVEDRVGIAGLMVDDQSVATITSSQPATIDISDGDGAIGFYRQPDRDNTRPWFPTLCESGAVGECRFGIAEGASEGMLYLGGLEKSAYRGEMVTIPLRDYENKTWTSYGDMVVNNKVVSTDQSFYFASVTNFSGGPIETLQAIFDAAGLESYRTIATTPSEQGTDMLTAYFPCDKPPTLGIQFPSKTNVTRATESGGSSPVSTKANIFNFVDWAMLATRDGNDGNNCTLPLRGYANWQRWSIGQILYNGHYIDHNLDENTIGIARLE